jgi:hypothetical protein
MYFRGFKKLYYDFDIKGRRDVRIVADITKNVRFRTALLENILVYELYDMRDGETPEIVAEKFYGNPQLHWIIMLANNRYDYINDFPLNVYQMERFIENKYGDKKFQPHHYELDGYIVDEFTVGGQPVTNADFEYRLNDKKRTIKLIRRELVNRISTEFDTLMEGKRT